MPGMHLLVTRTCQHKGATSVMGDCAKVKGTEGCTVVVGGKERQGCAWSAPSRQPLAKASADTRER